MDKAGSRGPDTGRTSRRDDPGKMHDSGGSLKWINETMLSEVPAVQA